MEVIQDDLWLCDDCTLYAVNGDLSGIDYGYSGKAAEKRVKEVTKGVDALGPHLVPDFDADDGEGVEEFSRRSCDGCGTHLAGGRHRFAVLGEPKKKRSSGRARELSEMEELLEGRGYDPAHAKKLQQEGMGPHELEHILKTTKPGGVGSLEYTHRFGMKRR